MQNTEVKEIVDGQHVIRVVDSGDSESWTRHVIMPRELVCKRIRKLKARNKRVRQGKSRMWLVKASAWTAFQDHIVPESMGFHWAGEPWLKAKNRRFVVMKQNGGMDV